MNIQRIPISQLRPAPYNPRKPLRPGMPGYRRLERSLREFELVQPLVWNQTTGHVVSGHQRLEILKAQGATEIDAVVVALPLAKEKALNVALNNSLVGGEWDAARLIDLVEELQTEGELDVVLTGFDEDALRDLLFTPEGNLPDEEVGSTDGERVRVQFEVPLPAWEAVRIELDSMLAEQGIAVYVRMPRRRR